MIKMESDKEKHLLTAEMQGEPLQLMQEMGLMIRDFVETMCTNFVKPEYKKEYAEDLAKCFAVECLKGYTQSVKAKEGDNT